MINILYTKYEDLSSFSGKYSVTDNELDQGLAWAPHKWADKADL